MESSLTEHFLVKDQCGNHLKVHFCLFTYLTTHAIGLELVEDLSTSPFLRAYHHHCSIYFTPCFATLLAAFDNDTVRQAFAQKHIEFGYIPA